MHEHRLERTLGLAATAMCGGALAAIAALTLAACGGGWATARSSPVGVIDQATQTVQLNLIVTDSGLNGYASGQIAVRVPRGWKVDVFCLNQASTPRSCAVMSGAGAAAPAFAGATTPHPAAGVPAGGAANFSFIVGRVGSYRVASLVPGHQDRGLWERFEVVATGKPSVSMSPRPAGELAAHRS